MLKEHRSKQPAYAASYYANNGVTANLNTWLLLASFNHLAEQSVRGGPVLARLDGTLSMLVFQNSGISELAMVCIYDTLCVVVDRVEFVGHEGLTTPESEQRLEDNR